MRGLRKQSIVIAILLVFVGCSKGEDISMKVFGHIEQTVEIESDFTKSQERIFQLEKEEEELYNEIINLRLDDDENVVNLSTEAISLLDERLAYVKQEKESIEASREEFEHIEYLVQEIVNEEEKAHVEKMYMTMIKRYEAYDQVYNNYLESIQLTKELYLFFQEEEMYDREILTHITTVNDSYDKVIQANELFNKETVLYNQLKEEYYSLFFEN